MIQYSSIEQCCLNKTHPLKEGLHHRFKFVIQNVLNCFPVCGFEEGGWVWGTKPMRGWYVRNNFKYPHSRSVSLIWTLVLDVWCITKEVELKYFYFSPWRSTGTSKKHICITIVMIKVDNEPKIVQNHQD